MPLVFKKRIPRYGKQLRGMAKFLNTKYPTKLSIDVYVFPTPELCDVDWDQDAFESFTEEANRNEEVYGCYFMDANKIYLAVGLIDDTLAMIILAHEFHHAMANIDGKQLREDNAERFSYHAMLDYQTQFTIKS